MFDVPDAKRVRRSDLTTRSQSASPTPSSPDPSLEKEFQAQLAALYGPIPSTSTPLSNVTADQDDEAEDAKKQEFEFRLFSSAPTNTTTADRAVQKIVLNDSESEEGDGSREGRFLRPRPRSYYFATPASEERRKEYTLAALSGDQILNLSKTRAWGLEVPWRVKVLKVASSTKIKPASTSTSSLEPAIRIEAQDEDQAQAGKKTKPGKKRRIILREKKRKKEAAEEGRKKREEEKEAAEREKRTRRNREKKVKRKLKEKAKKAGAGNGFEGTEGERVNGQDVDMSGSGDD
ncbi:uncharacterized protein PAC_10184 [Phialocephala subalpina]|uniref:Uncharacterized protein n=1 Tax=Phialocephala subalpina TaxID=576137 RepID=A0A1L7X5I5_9HELO|nr:uncharacterized protein PAC_10184 [Phialocephala subalpina]